MDIDKIADILPILIMGSCLLLVAIVGGIISITATRQNILQSRVRQIVYIFGFGSFLLLLFTSKVSSYDLVFFVSTVAYLLTHLFLQLKRLVFKFLLPPLLLGAIILLPITHYKQNHRERTNVKSANADQLIIGDFFAYEKTTIKSPTFDRDLTLSAINQLEFYSGAETLYDLFDKIDAEEIIDNYGIMPTILDRFGTLKNRYKQIGKNRYKKVNN